MANLKLCYCPPKAKADFIRTKPRVKCRFPFRENGKGILI